MSFVCQIAGGRKFDLNKDGVAQYGMYADLLAYMRQQPGGEAASRLLFNSAEAYLRTWRLAEKADRTYSRLVREKLTNRVRRVTAVLELAWRLSRIGASPSRA